MARRRALSRAFEQFAVTSRDPQSGAALTRHPFKRVWAPALYAYCGGFEVKDNREGGADWTLCLILDGAAIHPDALADPDVQILPSQIDLDAGLSGARLTAVQGWLAKSGLPVTAAAGQTGRVVLQAIGRALNQSDGFDGDRD